MSCKCLKNDFNIFLSNKDCRSIILEDISVWMDSEFFAEPDLLHINIMPLSSGIDVDLILSIGKKNIYTSFDILGIPDTCISDDIYCIKTTSCGKTYSINRANLCSVYCKIDQLKAKAKTSEDIENYRELENFAEQIKVNSEFGKVETAAALLKLLNKRLKNTKCGYC